MHVSRELRSFGLVGVAYGATLVLATLTASADPAPTTQACLGNFDAFLTCPAGAQRRGTECRTREPHGGQGAGEHWSGSKRQGPAIFLRDADERDPAKQRVSFAAYYKDHKKHGRVFNFDRDGRLDSWSDMADDQYNGLSVTCLPNGRVSHLAWFKNGAVVGISRTWKASDGSFSYAYDQTLKKSVDVPPAMQQRPDQLCQPARCDVTAKPDLSGIPKQP
ncbi:MAG TPA: hypothetical protein VFQ53_08375 [Kofleriaceae bacterium]|nr:hypothetical protein [Kofleriaceae bacterium]